jgi:uncharacterized protein YjiS (DUF1127 family)
MSKHLRNTSSVFFLHYRGLTLPHHTFDRTQTERCQQTPQQKRAGSSYDRSSSILLRDDHIVLLAIDALLALHTSFKKWRNRRRTLQALAELDDRQLRDIGLERGDYESYCALSDDDAPLGRLSKAPSEQGVSFEQTRQTNGFLRSDRAHEVRIKM